MLWRLGVYSGCHCTSLEYQQFLKGHGLVCSMSDFSSSADRCISGKLLRQKKRERVNRRRYVTLAEARIDIFDYIE
ncbi:MAG: hypothetical protein WBN40_06110, partial [Pseudomonadales bacterium]